MNPILDIILPVYYEEENISVAISQITKHVKSPHRILIIYDSEKDPTVPIVKQLKKTIPHIQLIKNRYKSGVVNALKTGMEKSNAIILTIMMADLSDNPKDIDKMVQKIQDGYDLVCASRYSGKGQRMGGPIIKGSMSYLACKTLALLTGIPTNDATNAFKTFRRSMLDTIKIESIGGFELPLELTVKAFAQKRKITEIPTIWIERKQGTSKFKLIHWLPQYLKWYVYALRNVF